MAGRGAQSAGPDQPIFQNPLTPMPGMPVPPPSAAGSSQRSRRRALEDPVATTGEADANSWYVPAFWAVDDFQLQSDLHSFPHGTGGGNWGKKAYMGARFERRKKMASWGVRRDDWDTDERARDRIRSLKPPPTHGNPPSPPPPSLPHLRSPSPPLIAPYPQILTQHPNYSSFVMDESVQHSFRSNLIDEVSQAIGSLIEAESGLLIALGRLWQAIESTPMPTPTPPSSSQDGLDPLTAEATHALHVPNLNTLCNYLFVAPPSENKDYVPNVHANVVEEGISFLKELHSDSLEYVERLEETREGLGLTVEQREALWTVVREKALVEMDEEEQEEAKTGQA